MLPVYTKSRRNTTYKKEMVPIEIKIPKEIRNYHENIFFGLNTRQFVCSLLALGAAVGLYFCLRPIVGAEQVGWMCILGAAPFAACGFFSYHGMTAEQLLWAWIKSEILMPKRLVFKSDCLYYQVMQPAISEGCKPKRHKKKRSNNPQNPQTDKTKPKRRKRMKKNRMIAENVTAPEAHH